MAHRTSVETFFLSSKHIIIWYHWFAIDIFCILLDSGTKQDSMLNMKAQWRIQGRALGGPAPPWLPLIFRPNWGPKCGENFFGRPGPPLSQGLDPALKHDVLWLLYMHFTSEWTRHKCALSPVLLSLDVTDWKGTVGILLLDNFIFLSTHSSPIENNSSLLQRNSSIFDKM